MGSAFDGMTREQLLAVVKALGGKAPPSTDNITIRDVIDHYLGHMRDRVAKGEIHADYLENVERDIERFASAHGGSLVKDSTQYTLTTFIRSRPAWRSSHAQKAVSGHIVTCMRWAKEQGLIAENPFRRVNPRVAPRTRRPIVPAEYVALMRRASRALRRILYFLRKTGCRTSEARELTWATVHLDADVPHVKLTQHKTAKATGKPRFFALDRGTVRFLAALKRQAPPKMAHVFFNVNGRPWTRNALVIAFRRTRALARLDEDVEGRISCYGLRHMYVVQSILAGMSTRRIADQLGHQTTAMIDKVYGATTRENLANLGKIANEAVRSRLRERPKPLVDQEFDDLPTPETVGPERFKAALFGHKLRGLRLNAGLSQKELGERVGLTKQHVMDMERGYHRPTVEMVFKLAEVFGTDCKYFEDAAA